MSDSLELKFCKNCANLIGNRDTPERSAIWECGAEQNKTGEITNLLTGELVRVYRVKFCSDNRQSFETQDTPRCGVEGSWFIEYKRPIFLESEESRTLTTRKRVTESDLANL